VATSGPGRSRGVTLSSEAVVLVAAADAAVAAVEERMLAGVDPADAASAVAVLRRCSANLAGSGDPGGDVENGVPAPITG
jgi:hypothetical protein